MKQKIILKKMQDFELYVNWDNDRNCWVLEDQLGETITTFRDKKVFNDLEKMRSIADLQYYGLVLNVMWADNLLELYCEWLKYLFYEEDRNYQDYTYNEFIDNIPINQITNNEEVIYFIVDYTEV